MTSNSQFTHFTPDGRPVMVDVGDKEVSKRVAMAESTVQMMRETRDAIVQHSIRKGDVLQIAQLAGIMAAKKTSDLIPLCHQIPLHHVSLELEFEEQDKTIEEVDRDVACLRILARVETAYQTGVEMEALTACTIAALTVYDMCKAMDRGITVSQVRLIYKDGGKSGVFQAIST